MSTKPKPKMILVPAELSSMVLQEFILTYREGETGPDAWRVLVEKVGTHPHGPGEVRAQEEQIVAIRDVHGEPALVFPDTPKKQVVLLLSHLAQHVTGIPHASEALKKAVGLWKTLKATGHRS